MSVSVQVQSCLLRSLIQRVNGSLGSVMSEHNNSRRSDASLPGTVANSAPRWHNAILTQVKFFNPLATNHLTQSEDSYLISVFLVTGPLFSLLQQEVSVKNQKISTLELEKDALLEQLNDLEAH